MEKTIEVRKITKIEGRMNVSIFMRGNEVVKVRAEALEGIRLLERILRGKRYNQIPDITSRMCGVCQAIHRITSIQAIEKAFGIKLPERLKILRKIVAISGHLQSHILHLYVFVLPGLLGHESIIGVSKKDEKLVRKVFALKKMANKITEIVGGRAVHPITPIVGGFSKLPSRLKLLGALKSAKEFKERAKVLVERFLELESPSFSRERRYMALHTGDDYPLLEGEVSISGETYFDQENYEKYIKYVTEEYSSARHYILEGLGNYMVGALSRVNVNHRFLSDSAKSMAERYGIKFPSHSPFDNNKAQALEIIHFSEELVELLEEALSRRVERGRKSVEFNVRKGEGISITEAPRGLLIHHYVINDRGVVESANIITPTAQNYKSIEEDLKYYVPWVIKEGRKNIEKNVESLVRAYDPCVSCSARFFREH
ncbi:MAG: Ni/Fe hydrogenase subunit alpha [Candidatus Asgardarchaeia archaeon]